MTLTREQEPALLTPGQAGELLGISRSKVYSLIAQGRLPAVRLTGSVRIPRSALLELVAAATQWPESPISDGPRAA